MTALHKLRIGLGNKGHVHTPETRLKIRLARIGKKLTEEHKRKISLGGMGRKHTEETKEKIRKNNKAWRWKGTKHTPETIEKMRQSHIGKKLSAYHKQRMSEVRRGDKNHAWRGGISGLIKQIRGSLQYRTWREEVFKRDNWMCVNGCTRGSKVLHADHIVPFSVLLRRHNIITPEQSFYCVALWNLDNGRTLCVPCHKSTDTFGFKMKAYKKVDGSRAQR